VGRREKVLNWQEKEEGRKLREKLDALPLALGCKRPESLDGGGETGDD